MIGNLASKYPGDEEALRLTVEVMGTGGTKAMLAVKMGVTRRCIELWQNNNETFRAIMDVGETLAQSWFEGVGLDGLQGNSLNANHWKFFMTTRFKEDYVERTNLTVTGVEALLAEIHDRGEKLLSAG